MKSFEEVNKFLESEIPRSEIWKRPGGGGKELSYFEYWFVNDLLNRCFGNMGWSSETHGVDLIPGTQSPTYKSRVTIKAMVQGPKDANGQNTYLTVTHDGIGTCSGTDQEMAAKGAESDAFKRAAVKFGKRLGLALYDKSEEFISDDGKTDTTQPAGSKPEVQKTSPKSPTTPKVQPLPQAQGSAAALPATREQINSLIRSTASVAFSKKSLVDGEPWTLDRMKAKIASYGVSQTDELTDEQANEVLDFLKGIIL